MLDILVMRMSQSEGDQCSMPWLSEVDYSVTQMVQEANYEDIDVKPIVDINEVPRRLSVFKQATSGQTVEHLNQDSDTYMMSVVGGDFGAVKSALGGPLFRRHSIMAQDSLAVDSEVDEDSKLGD